MSTFEPYSAKWYAEVFDRTEARYCEADMDRLRAENERLTQLARKQLKQLEAANQEVRNALERMKEISDRTKG